MLELEVWVHRLAQRWNERFTALDAVLEELKAGGNFMTGNTQTKNETKIIAEPGKPEITDHPRV